MVASFSPIYTILKKYCLNPDQSPNDCFVQKYNDDGKGIYAEVDLKSRNFVFDWPEVVSLKELIKR